MWKLIYSVTVFTDSPKKQQVFVANRAAEVLENSSMGRDVKGTENPADIGTGGMLIEGLRGVWVVKRTGMAPDRRRNVTNVPSAKWTNLKLSQLPVLATETKLGKYSNGDDTVASTEIKTSLPTAWGSTQIWMDF